MRRDRVVLSWFSVASVAAAIDGRVVLLDTYIHKGEDRPNYVPTTTNELVALAPEAIFIGHGHFDHANTGGEIAARTGALVVGTPEHCDQAKEQAKAVAGPVKPVRCLAAVGRGSAPGAQVNRLAPLGDSVAISALQAPAQRGRGARRREPRDQPRLERAARRKPAAAPPAGRRDGRRAGHPRRRGLDACSTSSGSASSRSPGTTRVGPLRERAPAVFGLLRRLPPTDVELGLHARLQRSDQRPARPRGLHGGAEAAVLLSRSTTTSSPSTASRRGSRACSGARWPSATPSPPRSAGSMTRTTTCARS